MTYRLPNCELMRFNISMVFIKIVCADFVVIYSNFLRSRHGLEILYGLKVFKNSLYGL